jgi:adenylate cyclase
MNVISPLGSLISSFIVSIAYSYATEGKERRFIKKTFSQYMDGTLVEHVLGNPQLIKPGGQKRRVTVFFADIAGFTSIAERVSPEDIARILHTILNTLTEVIIERKGVIDKYIGDCIMAFWGAPLSTKEDELHACSAALRCIASLTEINRKFREEGFSEIAIRIGMHSGDAIVGNLGSDRLFDYTVVGDTVNLASRLESVNKLFKTRIIVSEATLKTAGDGFLVRELGLIEVKGKTVPVKIFELMEERSDLTNDKKGMVELFHEGLTLFRERKWADAMESFGRILKKYPGDGPSEFYKKRCECMMAQPQLTEDCHIIKMTEK